MTRNPPTTFWHFDDWNNREQTPSMFFFHTRTTQFQPQISNKTKPVKPLSHHVLYVFPTKFSYMANLHVWCSNHLTTSQNPKVFRVPTTIFHGEPWWNHDFSRPNHHVSCSNPWISIASGCPLEVPTPVCRSRRSSCGPCATPTWRRSRVMTCESSWLCWGISSQATKGVIFWRKNSGLVQGGAPAR